MSDMLHSINELMFLTKVQVARDNTNSTFAQNVAYKGTKMTIIYQSNYKIMVAAVVINFLGLISILPVYYGW